MLAHVQSSHRGFTLVELLVVIGIIALLISILLPSLNRARESAKAVNCASNLRQMHFAFRTYSDANNGRFPAAWAMNGQGYGDMWIYQWQFIIWHWVAGRELAPQQGPYGMQGGGSIPWGDMWWDFENYPRPNTTPIMFCPTNMGEGLTFDDRTSYSYAIAARGQNPWAPNSPQNANDRGLWGVPNLARIKYPSEKLHLADMHQELSGGNWQNRPWFGTGATWRATNPHSGKSNFLFYDGHVSRSDGQEFRNEWHFDVDAH